MPNPFITIGYDVSDAAVASAQFVDLVKNQAQVLGDFTVKMLKFNDAGELVQGTIEQLDGAGRKIQTTFEGTKRGIEQTTQAILENVKAQQAAIAAAASAPATAQAVFPVPSTANIGQILNYNRALATLQQEVAKSGATAAQVKQMFSQAAAAPEAFARSIATLPPQLRALATAIANVGASAQAAGAQGAAGGNRFALSWAALTRVIEVQLIRRAISGAIQAIQQGIASAIDYQIKLQQAANVAGQTGAAFTQFAASVRSVSETFGVSQFEALTASQIALTSQLGNAANGFEVVNAAARLSVATGTDLVATTRLLTTTLEAYNISSLGAGNATEILMNVAQRTRIPLEQLQNSIGRAGPLAEAAGLSFEQVAAMLETLAQQGRRPTETLAQLNQVLAGFINPSKEMEGVLNRMGASSLQGAIQIHTLEGFLNRLNIEIQASPEALAHMAGSMRRLQGMLGLTADESIRLTTNLQAMGSTDVGEALDNVVQTPAQRIKTEFEKIKNFFTQDVGQALISGVVKIVEALGGVKPAFIAIKNAIIDLGVAWITFKAAMIGVSAWNALSAAMTAAATATKATGVAASFAATAWAGFKSILSSLGPALIAGGITAVVTALNMIGSAYAQADARIQELARRDAVAVTEDVRKQNEQVAAEAIGMTRIANEEVTKRFAGVTRYTAAVVQQSREQRDAVIAHQREITDQAKTAQQGFLDIIRGRMADARRVISESEGEIKKSRRRIADITEEVPRRSFQQAMRYEQDPLRQEDMLKARQTTVDAQARAAYASGDVQRIEAARRSIKELERLNDERLQHEVEEQRKHTEEMVRAGLIAPDATGQVRMMVDMTRYQAESRRITQLEVNLETRNVQLQQEREAAARQVETEKEKLRQIEAQFRMMDSFKIFNEQGQYTGRFAAISRQQGPQAAGQAALAEYDRMVASATRLMGVESESSQLVRSRLMMMREGYFSQIQAQQQLNLAQAEQVRIQQIASYLQKQQKESIEAAAKAEQNRNETLGEASKNALAVRGTLTASAMGQNSWMKLIANWSKGEREGLDTELATARSMITEFERRVTAQRRGTGTADAVREQGNLIEAEIARIARKYKIDIGGVEVGETGRSIAETLRQAGQSLSAAGRYSTQMERAQQSAFDTGIALTEVEQTVRQIGAGMDNLGPSRDGMQIVLTVQTANTELQESIRRLGLIRQGITEMPALPRLVIGRDAQPRATGGPVFANGGPVGTDTIPAWLSPGEYVINAESTRRFYSQLVSINAGMQPRYMSQGGPVNVGDINVYLSGGDRPETNVREFGKQLNREIRRGTINFRGSDS